MLYKYHERAIVFNEKNLVRLWDVAYDGYCGGKDATFVNWETGHRDFNLKSQNMSTNYRGPSMMVMAYSYDTASQQYTADFKRHLLLCSMISTTMTLPGQEPSRTHQRMVTTR